MIDTLPDDVLLEIFEFYLDEAFSEDGWHALVHVCQRWRNLVFGSPRRLDLQLRCTEKRPVREMLDVWPALPIAISGNGYNGFSTSGADNIAAALECNDRVCVFDLWGDLTSILSRSAVAIQKPFPVLLNLNLRSNKEWVPPLSDSFLGGSAPLLRSIRLDSVPFPGVRKLLSTTSDLVHLGLWDISSSGHISPETMVMSLSSLTQLKSLYLGFQSRPGSESQHSSPQTCVLLPNLTHFCFQGANEYLEELVAHIDAPLLHYVRIILFNEHSFDISELPQFINRSEKFTSLNTTTADLTFSKNSIELTVSLQTETVGGIRLALCISCKESIGPPASLSHVFGSSLPPLSTSERLDIRVEGNWRRLSQWEYALENIEWTDLLRPFTAVKDLYLVEGVALRLAPALKDVAEGRVNDVLPALQNVFFEGLQPTGPVQEAIGRFASARQLSSHPIVIHPWERRW